MSRFIEPVNYTEMVEIFVKLYFENMFKGKIAIDIKYEPRAIVYQIKVTHSYNNITSSSVATISCMFTTDKMIDTLEHMKEEIIYDYKLKLAEAQKPLW